jgi:hypothetical protein
VGVTAAVAECGVVFFIGCMRKPTGDGIGEPEEFTAVRKMVYNFGIQK